MIKTDTSALKRNYSSLKPSSNKNGGSRSIIYKSNTPGSLRNAGDALAAKYSSLGGRKQTSNKALNSFRGLGSSSGTVYKAYRGTLMRDKKSNLLSGSNSLIKKSVTVKKKNTAAEILRSSLHGNGKVEKLVCPAKTPISSTGPGTVSNPSRVEARSLKTSYVFDERRNSHQPARAKSPLTFHDKNSPNKASIKFKPFSNLASNSDIHLCIKNVSRKFDPSKVKTAILNANYQHATRTYEPIISSRRDRDKFIFVEENKQHQ